VVLENGRRAALTVALPRRIAPDAYHLARESSNATGR
jgi:hypothetical protein